MLEKRLYEQILGIALSGGADFAEIYCEYTRNGRIALMNGRIESITDEVVSGVGIRAFRGTSTVYGSTSDITPAGLVKCAKSVAEAMGEIRDGQNVILTERIFPNIHPVRIVPSSADIAYKTDLLKLASNSAKAYDKRIVQAAGNCKLGGASYL